MECIKVERKGDIEIRYIRDFDGNMSRIYLHRGVVLPKVILSGNVAEQMKSFKSIDKDLRNILSWISQINEIFLIENYDQNFYPSMHDSNAAIAKGLFIAILSVYGRCFTQANGRKFTLDKKHVPEKYKSLHDELMDARHNFAAHKGDFEGDNCQIVMTVSGNAKRIRSLIFSETQQPYFSQDLITNSDGNEMIGLCEELRKVVNDKYDEICNRINHNYVYLQPVKIWAGMNNKMLNIDSIVKGK